VKCPHLHTYFLWACSMSTKYWLLSTIWRLCQSLFYFNQLLTAFNNLKIVSEVAQDNCKRLKLFKNTGMIEFWLWQKSPNCWKQSVFSRSRTSSDKNLQIVEGSQYLVEVVLIPKLTAFNNLKIVSEVAQDNCKRLKLFKNTGMIEFCLTPN
jgi:ribosomal protein S17E